MMEPAETQPGHGLTPSGNLTLVDDLGVRNGEGQQFVTLVTKNGNDLYLIIDREEKGEEEVTIKFGKGLAEPFQSKDGREFMRISIPNQNPADKTPRASFVLPAKAVHENQYGKGLWAKIPADGTTVVTKPTLQGQDDKGKNIWQDVKIQVPNTELKAMVEAYKARAPQAKESEPRESAREKLDALVKDTAVKVSIDKSKRTKAKTKGPEL